MKKTHKETYKLKNEIFVNVTCKYKFTQNMMFGEKY
jgi:hypothetical protein